MSPLPRTLVAVVSGRLADGSGLLRIAAPLGVAMIVDENMFREARRPNLVDAILDSFRCAPRSLLSPWF